MLKKTLLTILFCMLAAGLGGGYFYHAGNYAHANEIQKKCTAIDIHVMDSLENGLVTCRDVMAFLSQGKGIIGVPVSKINLYEIENSLRDRGEVLTADVYSDSEGHIGIDLTQRRAVLRLCGNGRDFYSDSTGYLFPIYKNADVPVITGNIPVSWNEGDKGYRADAKEAKWIEGAIALGKYIENNWFYHNQIAQIDVAESGDVVLYTRDGEQKFIFGNFDSIEDKFSRMTLYYKGIASGESHKKYNTVNVKYKNQIICR